MLESACQVRSEWKTCWWDKEVIKNLHEQLRMSDLLRCSPSKWNVQTSDHGRKYCKSQYCGESEVIVCRCVCERVNERASQCHMNTLRTATTPLSFVLRLRPDSHSNRDRCSLTVGAYWTGRFKTQTENMHTPDQPVEIAGATTRMTSLIWLQNREHGQFCVLTTWPKQ